MGSVAACCVALASYGSTVALAGEAANGDPKLVRVSAPDTPVDITAAAPPGVVGTLQDGGSSLVTTAWPAAPGWAPSAAGVGNRWMVVIIQATLAERGCSRLAVNGEWDEHTQQAAASVIGSTKVAGEALALQPNDQLLRALRMVKASNCGLEGGELQAVSRTEGPVGGRMAPAAKGARSAAKGEWAGRGTGASRAAAVAAKQRSTPTQAAKVSRKAVASAPRPAREAAASVSRARPAGRPASGPVAFVRPVGIGSF